MNNTHIHVYTHTHHLFPKNNVLIQPKDATEAKRKFRIPPKQEVKTESFQGIQLKPVTKDGKQPQQAESTKVELKVAPLKRSISTILLQNLYVAISLCLFISFAASTSALLNSAKVYLRASSLILISYTFQDVSYFSHAHNTRKQFQRQTMLIVISLLFVNNIFFVYILCK